MIGRRSTTKNGGGRDCMVERNLLTESPRLESRGILLKIGRLAGRRSHQYGKQAIDDRSPPQPPEKEKIDDALRQTRGA